MTDGTSQGLFIVVAIVIFGIFVVLAYILFEDTLSPAMASMFNDAVENPTLAVEYGDQFEDGALVPDKHLQKAIRDTLGLPNNTVIDENHLLELKDLRVNVSKSFKKEGSYNYKRGEMKIRSLEGLEHATNLHTLYLDGNRVESLEPLRNLTELKSLNINMNKTITDLSPLEGLVNMLNLMIEGNPYTDLSPIKNMNKLSLLNISYTDVTDASIIGELPSITHLYLRDVKLTNGDFLNNLPNLTLLDVSKMEVQGGYTVPSTVKQLINK